MPRHGHSKFGLPRPSEVAVDNDPTASYLRIPTQAAGVRRSSLRSPASGSTTSTDTGKRGCSPTAADASSTADGGAGRGNRVIRGSDCRPQHVRIPSQANLCWDFFFLFSLFFSFFFFFSVGGHRADSSCRQPSCAAWRLLESDAPPGLLPGNLGGPGDQHQRIRKQLVSSRLAAPADGNQVQPSWARESRKAPQNSRRLCPIPRPEEFK